MNAPSEIRVSASSPAGVAPRRRRAPGPVGSLLLGSLGRVRVEPLRFFLEAWGEFGDVVRLRLGWFTAHLILHPEAVQQVLQENHRNYDKRTPGFNMIRLALGNGLLTSEGEFWRRQRRIAQPAFHKERLRHFGAVMTGLTEATVEGWRQPAARGETIDVAAEMMRLTLKIISRTMFSVELSAEVDVFGHSVQVAQQYLNRRLTSVSSLVPMFERLPTRRNREFRRALGGGDALIRAQIEERRRSDARPSDLLTMLIEARDEETGEGMTDQQLRDEIITIFSAGHETTANTLTWTWYLLSKHPEVRRRLSSELDRVLGGRVPVIDDLPRLEYATCVIKEAMRLYPPAWIISRRAVARDQLGGYDIPAGSLVLLSPWVTHRHSLFWDNPEGFEPERFEPARAAALPRYAYFPFGGGPRLCIGNNFAMMEAVLLLATVARRYRLDLDPGHPVDLNPLITLRPRHGVRMHLTAR